jgi:hypothetical protein
MHLEEHLLNEILHVGASPEQPMDESRDVRPMRTKEIAEGLLVTSLASLNESLRVDHGR